MGIGRRTLAIRRAVWARGVRTLEEAVNYVNGLIASEAQVVAAAQKKDFLRILDIGCGVGGSLLFLASVLKTGFRGVGITISPRQSRIASRQAAIRGLSATCSFLAGDFTLVSGLRPFDLSFAIESFVHFTSPAAFFAPAAGLSRAGGTVARCRRFPVKEKVFPPGRKNGRGVPSWVDPVLPRHGRACRACRRGVRTAAGRGPGAQRVFVTTSRGRSHGTMGGEAHARHSQPVAVLAKLGRQPCAGGLQAGGAGGISLSCVREETNRIRPGQTPPSRGSTRRPPRRFRRRCSTACAG